MAKNVKCRRCGCTDARACEGGCEWIAESDVCSACLTTVEQLFWMDLVDAVTVGERHARKRMLLFGQILSASPRVRSETGGGQ